MSTHARRNNGFGRALAAAALCALTVGRPARAQAPADVVWLESQDYVSINVKANDKLKLDTAGWGNKAVLSGETWFQAKVEQGDANAQVPDDGIVLSYKFNAPKSASYQLWNRVGYEYVRSPFDWRVDGGKWTTIAPDHITTDMMELATWNPVAWLQMGDAQLKEGAHTLDIRIPKTKNEKGEVQNLLYASDAIAISATPFRPNGPFKPGQDFQTAQDKSAATQVFKMPDVKSTAQTALSLKGVWQIARWDEGEVVNRTAPIATAPKADELFWRSIAVPGDRNKGLPEWYYAHRYFYRTRVSVPANQANHSFYLHFPSVSMIASVWVNGQLCGSTRAPFAAWDCDVSRAIKAGANEIWVGIKDSYYALEPEAGKPSHQLFYVPADFLHYQGTSMRYDFPVWNHINNGLLTEPTLVSAGVAYTSDVFAIPSVKKKSLGLEITVKNPTNTAMTVSVQNAIEPLTGGAAEKTFKASDVQIAANSEKTVKVSEAWADAKLWWPDDPQQYNVVTRLSLNGAPIDERRTKFGFREWDWSGWGFKLNGVPWHGRADLVENSAESNPEGAVKTMKQHGQTMFRLWGQDNWGGLGGYQQSLDFFDRAGMPVRRTGIFDGEGANYGLITDSKVDGKDVRTAHKALYDNWINQLSAQVRGERNHPSVFIWSMENEITFINAKVFGLNEWNDPEMKRAADALAAIDPTRPQMVDGGNALLDQSLPVYGGHYVESSFDRYPEEAYTLEELFRPNHQVWPISKDKPKPILIGESFYAAGTQLTDFAGVGGESAFIGKSQAAPTVGLVAKMLSEGYRWSNVNFHYWFGGESDLHYNSWQPIAVLCRQWDWTFGSGQKVRRTFGIFNDTHYAQPITFTWTLNLNGKNAGSKSQDYSLAPGGNRKFDLTIPMPQVTARQDGDLTLTLSVKGKPVFKDVKPLSVLNTGATVATAPTNEKEAPTVAGAPRTSALSIETRAQAEVAPRMSTHVAAQVAPGAKNLFVYDPKGTIGAFLKARGMAFTALKDLKTLPTSAKTLIIGKDALDVGESTSSRLAAYASAGHNLIVLEQKNPLKYQALPAEMQTESNEGHIAFSEDLDHPVFKNLQQRDFFTWGPDGVVYRDAYVKPTLGGKSLVQVSSGLRDTALAEVPVGRGLMLLSQLTIGEKLPTNAVAQQMLLNMVNYASSYKLTHRAVTVVAEGNPQLQKTLAALGLQSDKANDVLAAIAKPGTIAVVDASPANLKQLADNKAKVDAFTKGGGWIVFNNLTPEGLSDYNKIVGFGHMIRAFRRERVTFPPVRNPLTAGLSTSNIVMGSGEQIFPWAAGQYPATDAFSYVVDYDDVAPFGKTDNYFYENAVNNFVQADAWKLINNFAAPKTGSFDIPFALPKAQTISEFTWIGNTLYNPQTKVGLVFDGKDKVAYDVQPNAEPQTFAVTPPRTGQQITLQILDSQDLPGKGGTTGIDNFYLKARRPADFYKNVRPMLNIGAMMEYPRGNGGIVLCNVKFQDSEAVPENMVKKQAIISTILRNLLAPFSGGKTVIAGANLQYTPIDLSKQANQYRTDQGWFGDKSFTFADLPTGKQNLGGVNYNIYNFTTSPVPTAIMLGGDNVPGNLPQEVKGIPVGQKADALFFLQAARIDQLINDDDRRNNRKFEMARYVVNYADGQTANIPIYSEVDVDDYKQQGAARAIPGAQIAWTKPYAGTDFSAVAYSRQWNNPRPDVEIKSIDFVYGAQKRGVPVLLALTAAKAQ